MIRNHVQNHPLYSKNPLVLRATGLRRGVCSIVVLAAVIIVLMEPSTYAQSAAVEYDASGQLVPATLPHMYRYAFRLQNLLESLANQHGGDGSIRSALRFRLGMSEGDFALFEYSAKHFGDKDKELRRNISTVSKKDWARHPATRALSDNARKSVRALHAQDEEELAEDLATLKSGLTPAAASSLDAHIIRLYAQDLTVQGGSKTAPVQHPVINTPNSPRSETQLNETQSNAVTASPELRTPVCPVCGIPTGSLDMFFSSDGTTVFGTYMATISSGDEEEGCVPSATLSIEENGASIDTEDGSADGDTVFASTQGSVDVGATYSLDGQAQSCNEESGCSDPVISVVSPFQTGPPSISGVSQSSAPQGTSGSITLTGTDLGGPPGNTPQATATGTGLTVEAIDPTQYNQSNGNLSTGTQIVEYNVASNATIAQDQYSLTTVWGSTSTPFSVICGSPVIYNISPVPWTTGVSVPIRISGDGFCPGSTVRITVGTGTVSVSSVAVVNSQLITATVKPTSTTTETAQVTVANSSGTSPAYPVSIVGTTLGPLYLIDPYLLPNASTGTITASTALGTLPANTDYAQGLVVDGTSTVIVALKVSQGIITTFSVNRGSVAAFSTTFLTTAPSTSATSINVSATNFSANFYALALVQAPTSGGSGTITVTAKTSAGSTTENLIAYQPAVLLVHGLWGNLSSLASIQSFLTTTAGYSSDWVIPICYSPYLPWNATSDTLPGAGTGCEQTSATAIGNSLKNTVYPMYDLFHISGGRVDYIGHSMGGLDARNYGALSTYLTDIRSRHQGAIHTLITIDTPEQGSLLANYLLSISQCNVETTVIGSPIARSVLSAAGCSSTMTTQQCLTTAGMPLAAPGASINSGAVASLEPSFVNGSTAPGKPPHSVWVAISASYPDSASPGSILRNILQELITNFYGVASGQPAACNTNTVPTLTNDLGNLTNDVIVTTTSQGATSSVSPDLGVPQPGSLEHIPTPKVSNYTTVLQIISPVLSDANVLNSTNVNATIQQRLIQP